MKKYQIIEGQASSGYVASMLKEFAALGYMIQSINIWGQHRQMVFIVMEHYDSPM